MLLDLKRETVERLADHLRLAKTVTPALMADVTSNCCARLARMRHTHNAVRVSRLIEAGAWTDAALALIAIELPVWRLRRLAYDGGEWHCALSSQSELPEWLDQAVETGHPDLSLAILQALVEALRRNVSAAEQPMRTVPSVRSEQFERICCDNFA